MKFYRKIKFKKKKKKKKEIATDEKAVSTNWIFANQFLNPVAIHPSILILQEEKKNSIGKKKKN